jgi:hypothetical protein
LVCYDSSPWRFAQWMASKQSWDEGHWQSHVLLGHSVLLGKHELVTEKLQNADAAFRSKRDPSTRIYLKRYADIMLGDHLIEKTTLRVHVRENDGSVISAYFAAAWWRSLGEKLWPL